jgi:acetyltransferase-like isoleucine patch superfamily enzyme
LVKGLGRGISAVLVLPWLVSYWIRARVFEADRAILGSSQTLALLPGVLGQYLRRAFYSRILEHFDHSATVEFGTLFSRVGARVGKNVYIGPMCHIGLANIEANVLIAAGVHVPSGKNLHGTEDPSRPIRDQPGQLHMVRIGEGSWIGSAAVVMADVGRDTVVASGAVVTKPLGDRVIAGGVPAEVIRERSESKRQDRPLERLSDCRRR